MRMSVIIKVVMEVVRVGRKNNEKAMDRTKDEDLYRDEWKW